MEPSTTKLPTAKGAEQAIAEQFETNRSMRVEAGDRDEITGGAS